jgi:membrane fusion protein (multidrug efflux system)
MTTHALLPAAGRGFFHLVRRSGAGLLLVGALAGMTGCSRSQADASPPAPPAAAVGVVTLAPSAVNLTRELPGRTSPYRIAEVRARVSGIVLKRLFTEGSDIREGQVLFEIDAAPYRAALASAKATLARAEANLVSARAQANRFQALIEAKAVSRQDYDNATSTLAATEADVAAGRAAVESAAIDLSYTTVTAPVSGRIGRSSVTEGAFVQQSQATLLATVQQLDPIYVDLKQSSTEWLRLKDEIARGGLQDASAAEADVALVMENNRDYAAPGRLQFSDITVDPGTGSIALRAIFPNPRHDLLPGMFVRARLVEGVNPSALLVPQAAVSRSSRGEATVFVVNAQSQAELRPITTARSVGSAWLVTSGLAAGDRVIVEGLQRLRPGMPVTAGPAGSSATPVAKPAVVASASR